MHQNDNSIYLPTYTLETLTSTTSPELLMSFINLIAATFVQNFKTTQHHESALIPSNNPYHFNRQHMQPCILRSSTNYNYQNLLMFRHSNVTTISKLLLLNNTNPNDVVPAYNTRLVITIFKHPYSHTHTQIIHKQPFLHIHTYAVVSSS